VGARVLIVGDVMLDAYLTGDAERISPEAPVPVVRVDGERHLVGGAGNVARNITALGGASMLIGVRGSDSAGEDLAHCLEREGVDFSLLMLQGRPTTVKTRVLARQQQVVRIDREDVSPLRKAQVRELLERTAKELPACGAVVISDYGKGVASREFMHGLRDSIRAVGKKIPVLVDPKPQHFMLYKGVTLLTPNAKETSEAVNMPVKTSQDVVSAGREVLRRLGAEHLVTTLGSQGMAVFESEERIWHIPTAARQVFDVTGAGDTVIAVLALGVASGLPLVQACLLANYAAGIVVAQVGAATVSAAALAEAVSALPAPVIGSWS
jgi:rfaE bifunctional protein kinase chain/domain